MLPTTFLEATKVHAIDTNTYTAILHPEYVLSSPQEKRNRILFCDLESMFFPSNMYPSSTVHHNQEETADCEGS